MDHPQVRLNYRQILELSLILAMAVPVVAFRLVRFEEGKSLSPADGLILEVADIPQTIQRMQQPLHRKPFVPIAAGSESVLEDNSAEEVFNDESALLNVPEPPRPDINTNEESVPFVWYSEPPRIIGGTEFITKHLKYPEMARLANMEGSALILVTVDEEGKVALVRVGKEDGNVGFGQAAMEVIRKCRFTPAMQRDKPVRVEVGINVVFRLK